MLLDALNEIPYAGAEPVRLWKAFLGQLERDYPDNRVVFSCRSLDYSVTLSSKESPVPQVRIEPLSDSQVAGFHHALLSGTRRGALAAPRVTHLACFDPAVRGVDNEPQPGNPVTDRRHLGLRVKRESECAQAVNPRLLPAPQFAFAVAEQGHIVHIAQIPEFSVYRFQIGAMQISVLGVLKVFLYQCVKAIGKCDGLSA